jgi:putative FmdB family regulatory protein
MTQATRQRRRSRPALRRLLWNDVTSIAPLLRFRGGPDMPTYQYRCKKCGKSFERSEHIAEHEKSHPLCPKCSSKQVEPVLADFYAKTSKKS